MELIDGNQIAAQLITELKAEVAGLAGRKPCLALVRVGDLGDDFYATGRVPGSGIRIHS